MIATLLVLGCSGVVDSRMEAQAPMSTDSVEYTWKMHDDWRELVIDYSFTNASADTLYLANCNGGNPPALERKSPDGWVKSWRPFMELCISPPIVVLPGETIFRKVDLSVSSTLVDGWSLELSGKFRLAWPEESLYRRFNEVDFTYEDPILDEERRSNAFWLKEP